MMDTILKDNHMNFGSMNGWNSWRERIVGLESKLPLLDGRLAPYINLDNAVTNEDPDPNE